MQGYSKKSRVFQNSPLQPKIIDTVKIMVTVKIHGTVKILERWKLIINKIKKKKYVYFTTNSDLLKKSLSSPTSLNFVGPVGGKKFPRSSSSRRHIFKLGLSFSI